MNHTKLHFEILKALVSELVSVSLNAPKEGGVV